MPNHKEEICDLMVHIIRLAKRMISLIDEHDGDEFDEVPAEINADDPDQMLRYIMQIRDTDADDSDPTEWN